MKTEKDKLVDELIDVVRARKNEIDATENARWQTNCSLSINGNRVNLQTVSSVEELVDILAALIEKKHASEAAVSLLTKNGMTVKAPHYMGFSYEQWEADIMTRAKKICINQKKAELKDIEQRLDKLVSKERREELELAAIKKQLGL